MGTGKSTLGKGLAARCEIEFVDLDDYIETRAGKKIREIFAEDGEKRFRELERNALIEMCERGGLLVACGGGTPCYGDNMELMNSRGTTVMLRASRNRLMERLKRGRAKRPLIANLDDEALEGFVDEQLAARMVHYGKSKHIFDSSTLEDENEIEQKCAAFIKQFNLPLKKL